MTCSHKYVSSSASVLSLAPAACQTKKYCRPKRQTPPLENSYNTFANAIAMPMDKRNQRSQYLRL